MPVLPSSRTALRARSSLVDAAWAVFAPILALYLRDAPALSYSGFVPTLLYCSISVAISLTAFSALRVQAGITRYFSVVDAVSVAKAVAAATFATYAVVFSLTRLDGIPRTTPIVHALILLDRTSWNQDFVAVVTRQANFITPTQGCCRQTHPDDWIEPAVLIVYRAYQSVFARAIQHHRSVGRSA